MSYHMAVIVQPTAGPKKESYLEVNTRLSDHNYQGVSLGRHKE